MPGLFPQASQGLISTPTHTHTHTHPLTLVCGYAQDSELQYEVEVAGPPLCLALCGEEGGGEGDEVLYGTQTGRLGLVRLTPHEPNYCWDMLNERRYVCTH